MAYTEDIGAMYFFLFLTPSTFILAAIILWLKPPKSINSIYGYRSASSFRSEKNWEYANRLAPKAMICMAIVLFILGWLLLQICYVEIVFVLLFIGIMIACTLAMLAFTEWKISKFEKEQSDRLPD